MRSKTLAKGWTAPCAPACCRLGQATARKVSARAVQTESKEDLKWRKSTIEQDVDEINMEIGLLNRQLDEKRNELRQIQQQIDGPKRSSSGSSMSGGGSGDQKGGSGWQQSNTAAQPSSSSASTVDDGPPPVAVRPMGAELEQQLQALATADLPADAMGTDAVPVQGQAGAGDVNADWVCAMVPYVTSGTQRLRFCFAAAVPAEHAAPLSMVWGIAFDGSGGWEEPPTGWFSEPATSEDAGIGAWTSTAAEAGELEADGLKLASYKLVLDMPWADTLLKQGGVPFKWKCGEKWLGAAGTGGNHVAAAHMFAHQYFAQHR